MYTGGLPAREYRPRVYTSGGQTARAPRPANVGNSIFCRGQVRRKFRIKVPAVGNPSTDIRNVRRRRRRRRTVESYYYATARVRTPGNRGGQPFSVPRRIPDEIYNHRRSVNKSIVCDIIVCDHFFFFFFRGRLLIGILNLK